MIKKPSIIYRINIASLFIVISFLTQSCGKTLYITGALTKSKFYTYDPDNSYNNQGGVSWMPKPGAQIGIAAKGETLSKNFSFRPEIIGSLQGARYEDVYYHLTGSINLIYFYVPLIIRYQRKSSFFGEAGIQPGLLLSARDRYEGKGTYYSDYLKKLDLGISGGLGYELKSNISIGLRVFQGFNNISTARIDGKSNHLLTLRLTYTLNKE
jgi:hypothetical protein